MKCIQSERMKTHALIPLILALLALPASAADWPQWGGPNRDNVSRETGLLQKWPQGGPKLLWTFRNAGQGYSGPAIVGDVLYCLGARGDTEYLFALDLKAAPLTLPSPPAGGEGRVRGASDKDVKELWSARIGPKFTWKSNQWNAGPAATPAVHDGLVYALGGQGQLVCVDAVRGTERWRKSLPADLAGEVNAFGGGPEKIGWGFTTSPLVDGDQVLCVPGGPEGTLAALDRKTGQLLWRSKGLTDQAPYASPIAADIGGVRQYLQMTYAGVAGVAARDGTLLWYYKHEEPYSEFVAVTPLVRDNLVFITVGGSGGCDLIRVVQDGSKFKAEQVYANNHLAVLHGGVALLDQHVYGSSGGDRRSKWVCLDFKSGQQAWTTEDRKLGRGSLTAADGCLYCFGESRGLVVLAEASQAKWTIKGQFSLPEESKLRLPRGGYWTHPVVAQGRLYLRDQELLFCYEILARNPKTAVNQKRETRR